MKIYLDTCSLQRPLDSKNQLRIALESEAILGLIYLCEIKSIELISSEALLFEIRRTPEESRKDYALEVLSKAKEFIRLNDEIQKLAEEFTNIGIKPLDALHLASAENSNSEYFCTCDLKFLKKAKKLTKLKIKIVSPLELIEELEK